MRSLCFTLLILLPAQAIAQAGPAVHGTVSEAGGAPLAGVRIEIVGLDLVATTNARGEFAFAAVPPGRRTVLAERRGWAPEVLEIEVADEPARLRIELQPLVLTTRVEVRGDELPVSATTISGHQLEAIPARSMDDLLRDLPAVQLPRSSSIVSHPTAQGASIRGVGSGRTLVLLDGVPLNDAFGGWIRWNRVVREDVDRVEVLRGGGSSLYGNYAMGGVIQMFSREPTGRTVAATGSLGSRDLQEGHLRFADVAGPWTLSLSGGVATGGGYATIAERQRGSIDLEAESTRRNVTGQVRYTPGPTRRFVFSADLFDEERGNGTPLTSNERTIGTFSLAGQVIGARAASWDFTLYGSTQSFENHNSRTASDRSFESPALAQEIPVDDVGASLRWSRQVGALDVLAFGIDGHYVNGENREQSFDASGAAGPLTVSGGSQVISGISANAVLQPVSRITLDAGARLDLWRNFDASRAVGSAPAVELADQSDSAWSPRVALRYAPGDRVDIRGAYYRAFRAPTLNELYRGFFAGNVSFEPNPALGPERLSAGEVGVQWRPGSGVRIDVAGFLSRGDDLVTFVTVGPARRVRQNLNETRTRGLEASVAFSPVSRLRISGSYTFLDAEILEAVSAATIGNRIPDLPRHEGGLRAAWNDPRTLDASLGLRFRSGEFDDDLNNDRLPGYAVVDLDLRRRFGDRLLAFVSIENLGDREVVTRITRGLISVGTPRTISVGFGLDVF